MTVEIVEEAEQELEADSIKTMRGIAVERRWDWWWMIIRRRACKKSRMQ